MGAYATWDLLVHAPAMFAVSIPSSGGGDTKLAARITGRLGLGLYIGLGLGARGLSTLTLTLALTLTLTSSCVGFPRPH